MGSTLLLSHLRGMAPTVKHPEHYAGAACLTWLYMLLADTGDPLVDAPVLCVRQTCRPRAP